MSYNTKLEDLIDHHCIANENLLKKKQMGGVGYLVNGNMCFGIYEDFLVVRTGKTLAGELIGKKGISRFVPDDKDHDEFIMVDPQIYQHAGALAKFLSRGISYTSDLPPKQDEDGDADVAGLY